jgi:hypothetical protein
MMGALALFVLTWVALVLCPTPPLAQTKEPRKETITELRRADVLADAANTALMRERSGSITLDPEALGRVIGQLKEAAELLVRFAPKPIADEELESIKRMFSSNGLSPPSTLVQAIESAEAAEKRELTQVLCGSIGLAIRIAMQDVEAEIAFGPIADNPVFYRQITPPMRGVHLLDNLDFALQHNVVLRQDFYTPENISRFFGAHTAIHRELDGTIWASWTVRPTAQELAKLEPGGWRYAAWQYWVRSRRDRSGKQSGEITITCNFAAYNAPTFEDVETVFGSQWRNGRLEGIPPHPPPLPSGRHGNAYIIYDLDTATLQRSIEVRFRADGTFGSFALIVKEK